MSDIILQNALTGTIPTEQAELVLKEFAENSVVTQLAKPEIMTKPVKKFSYLTQGPGAYWVSETQRITASKATWLQAELVAKKLAVIIPTSREFLDYTVADFFSEIRGAIAEAFYNKFDSAVLFGTETPYEKSIWDKIDSEGNKVVIGTGSNLYFDLNDALALVENGDNDPNGFVTTRQFKKDLRGTADENNNPIFNDARGGATAEALGLPIAFANGQAWDKDKALIIAGDWDYARYGILKDITYTISEEATLTTIVDEEEQPINLFERDMFALRAVMEIGFLLLKDDAFSAITPDDE